MDNPAVPIPSAPLQPAVEQPAVPPAETSSPRWLLWSAIGLIFLVLGIAVGLFSAKFLNQSQLQSQLPPTPALVPSSSATPAQEADPTAGWKIYTNDVLGFSLSYPQELSYVYDNLKDFTDRKYLSANLLLQNFDGSKPRQEEKS